MFVATTTAALMSGVNAIGFCPDYTKGSPDADTDREISELVKSLDLAVPKIVLGRGTLIGVFASGVNSNTLVLTGYHQNETSEERTFLIKKEVCKLKRKDPTVLAVLNAVNAILLYSSLFVSQGMQTILLVASLAIIYLLHDKYAESDREAEKFALENSTEFQKKTELTRLKLLKAKHQVYLRQTRAHQDPTEAVELGKEMFVTSVGMLMLRIAPYIWKENGEYTFMYVFDETLSEKIGRIEQLLPSA